MTCTLLSLFRQNPGSQQPKGMVPFCLRHLILSAECSATAGGLWVWDTTYPSEKLCASAGKCCHFLIVSLLLLSPENCRDVFKCLCPVVFLEELLARPERALHRPQDFAVGRVSGCCWATGWHHCIVLGSSVLYSSGTSERCQLPEQKNKQKSSLR